VTSLVRRLFGGGAIVLVALAGSVVAGPAAGAVTPRPTDDRSTVVAVTPGGAATATVIGGDSLVSMTVAPGHEVVVHGYAGEPYLRVTATGTVEVNRNSPAVSLNRTRDADLSAPGAAPADAVDWQPYQAGRTAVWHDHRIHAGTGATVTGTVPWDIPITVDGVDGTITGHLERLPSPSPLPALAFATVVAGLLYAVGRRRPILVTGVALGAAGVVAAVTGYLEWQALPSVVPRNAGLFLLPLGAAVALIVGLVARPRTVRLVALSAAISLLAGWIAFRWSIVDRAVLISPLEPVLDRLGLAFVLGAAVAAAGLVVSWAGSVPGAPTTAAPRAKPAT
jgi:hypothetical protein